MIAHAIICVIALAGNCVFVVGLMCPYETSNPDTIRVYKTETSNNQPEYIIMKRGTQTNEESPDSKDRRSQMGTSFMRFGRDGYDNNLEKLDYPLNNNEINEPVARLTRGRSDVIIRFGRSDVKNFSPTEIRGSRQLRIHDLKDLINVCCNVLGAMESNGDDGIVYRSELPRLCKYLGIETRRRNKIFDFLDNSPHDESIKNE